MTTTDKVRLAMPTAKSRYTSIGGCAGPELMAMTRPILNLNKPKINRTQAVIVDRALNIDGMLNPPLISYD